MSALPLARNSARGGERVKRVEGLRLIMTRLCALLAGLLLCCPGTLFADDWPRFRGPTGQGISTEKSPPLHWSENENLAWATPIPGAGWSSPVVCGGRVFVTTATNKGTSCHVLCLDKKSGQILWDQEVFRQELRRKQEKNSYATPTPATDGQLVFAVFAGGSLAALDYAGRIVWTYRQVKFYSQHGLGASPILYQDLVIMPFDGSSPGHDKEVGWLKPWEESFILALDKRTGQVRWKATRGPSRIAHATPVVFRNGDRDCLLSTAGNVVQAFDLETGRRLWSVPNFGEGLAPSVVIGDGTVFAPSGYGQPTLRAIDIRVKEPSIAWEVTKSVPMIPSALFVAPHLFTISEKGIAQCLEAKTGREVWQKRLGGSYSASPIYAAGKIYLLSEDGDMTVIESAGAFKELARNSIPGKFQASPALSDGQLILRSDKQVYCVGRRGL